MNITEKIFFANRMKIFKFDLVSKHKKNYIILHHSMKKEENEK